MDVEETGSQSDRVSTFLCILGRYTRLVMTVTAPDRCYCSNQAFLTVRTKGRAGEFPVGGNQ